MSDDDLITLAEACERVFSLEEAASELRLDPRALKRLVSQRKVAHARVGRRIFFDLHSLKSAKLDLLGEIFDAAQKTGFIYFLECVGFVKIGYSADPRKRINELAVGNPFEIKLLHTEPASQEAEKMLHEHFDASRARGEWFRLGPEIFKLLERRKMLLSIEATAAAIEAM